MGASESTEAPPPDQQTQTQPQTTTHSVPSTTAPAAATETPTTTPPTAQPPATIPATAPPPSTSTSTPAPSTSSAAPTPTPTTPSLKPSQLQLQAVAANVSSLALAPIAAGLAQPPTTTTTLETTPAVPASAAAAGAAPVAAATEPQVEFEPYVLGDHTSGLWYSLVEWCAPFLPDGIVLAWDEEQVAELVQAISGSEYFRSLLTKRHQERRARLRAVKDDPATTLPPLTNPDFAIPYDRAEQILDVDKRLGKLRKEFVPGRIAEDTFWYEYFLAVIQVIKAHVIGTQQHLRTQQIQVAQQQQSQQQQPQPQVAH